MSHTEEPLVHVQAIAYRGAHGHILKAFENVTLTGSKYGNLALLLKGNRDIGLSVYSLEGVRSGGKEHEAFLIMCHCYHDSTLIRLAHDCNMPRGFPIIYVPGVLLQVYGFYPKFHNDGVTDVSLMDSQSVTGTLKYSGFLGGIIPFCLDHTYVVFTSKNSACGDSPFVADVVRIMQSYTLYSAAIQELASKGQFLYGEFLSFRDQQHGYAIKKEAVVVTCIGECRKITVGEREADTYNFVKYLSQDEIMDFCVRHALPRDGYFHTKNVRALCEALDTARDFMTYGTLMGIVKREAIWVDGTTTHDSLIDGDVVEGLVLTDGTHTQKYKFPSYTIRTMLYRESLEKGTGVPNIDGFVQRWCVTPLGRTYWTRMARAFFMVCQAVDIPDDSLVARHIYVANLLGTYTEDTLASLAEGYTSAECRTVILILGPIGCGKSTIGKLLSEAHSYYVHIDGDHPSEFVSVKDTIHMGHERNPYTQWQVLKCLMAGSVPIVSSGGGALQGLRELAYRTLGVSLSIILYLPKTKGSDGVPSIDSIYSADTTVREVVTRRVTEGEWSVPPDQTVKGFIETIVSRSRKNKTFAQEFHRLATETWYFPYVTKENHNAVQEGLAVPYVEVAALIPKAATSQIRMLAHFSGEGKGRLIFGHATLQFRNTRKFQCLPMMPENFQAAGNLVELASSAGVISLIVPVEPIPRLNSDGSTHITVNPGIHAPKCMREVAMVLRNGGNTVTLDKVTYTVTTIQDGIIHFHDMFCL